MVISKSNRLLFLYKHYSLRIFFSLALCALLVSITSLYSHVAGATICYDLEIVFARGSNQEQGDKPEDLITKPQLTTFFNEIKFNLPASISANYRDLKYPAAGGFMDILNAEFSFIQNGLYRQSVGLGTDELSRTISHTLQRCPDTQFILGGFSQGAHVVGNTLFKLDDKASRSILYVALFGDPKFKPDSYAARGDFHPRTKGGILEPRKDEFPEKYKGRLYSWCRSYDHICMGQHQVTISLIEEHPHSRYEEREVVLAASEALHLLRNRTKDHFDVRTIDFKNGYLSELDLVLVVDSTGSMRDDLDEVMRQVEDISANVNKKFNDPRIGITTYRDDGYARTVRPLMRDHKLIKASLKNIEVRGGGDLPEAVNTGLMHALNNHVWREGAMKQMIVIGDGFPHVKDRVTNYTFEDVKKRALEIDPVVVQLMPSRTGTNDVKHWKKMLPYIDGNYLPLNGIGGFHQDIVDNLDRIWLDPIAYAGDLYEGKVGQPISFSAAGSYDPDSPITTYRWDFDFDGIYEKTTSHPVTSYVYDSAYDGMINVHVTSADGGSSSATPIVRASDDWRLPQPPEPPKNLFASRTGSNSAQVSWDSTEEKVLYVVRGEGGDILTVTQDSSISVSRIEPWSVFQVYVSALGTAGESDRIASNKLTFNDTTPRVVAQNISSVTDPGKILAATSSVYGGFGNSIYPENTFDGAYASGSAQTLELDSPKDKCRGSLCGINPIALYLPTAILIAYGSQKIWRYFKR